MYEIQLSREFSDGYGIFIDEGFKTYYNIKPLEVFKELERILEERKKEIIHECEYLDYTHYSEYYSIIDDYSIVIKEGTIVSKW